MKVAIICITGGRCTEISKNCFELPESGYDENEINDILVKQKYLGFDEDIYDELINNLYNPEWIGLFNYEAKDIVTGKRQELIINTKNNSYKCYRWDTFKRFITLCRTSSRHKSQWYAVWSIEVCRFIKISIKGKLWCCVRKYTHSHRISTKVKTERR